MIATCRNGKIRFGSEVIVFYPDSEIEMFPSVTWFVRKLTRHGPRGVYAHLHRKDTHLNEAVIPAKCLKVVTQKDG